METEFKDLLLLINESSKNKGLGNRLYGLRRKNGVIEGKIVEGEREEYWIPKCRLCSYHEKLIDKWEVLQGYCDRLMNR